MTEAEMMVLVPEKLKEIERLYNIKVLFAAESGSRAWRTASVNSDFDIRFIYVCNPTRYLRLDTVRDVIDFPIEDGWDMVGWDLNKTLRLLHNSNPNIFDWFNSPIIYTNTEFAKRFQPIMEQYFSVKTLLYHYINTAKQQKNLFLQGDMVKVKKYLYILHPLMAASWVLKHNSPSPVNFRELIEAELPHHLHEEAEKLLTLKTLHPEILTTERIPILDKYINDELKDLNEQINQLPDTKEHSWDALNAFFLSELKLMEEGNT